MNGAGADAPIRCAAYNLDRQRLVAQAARLAESAVVPTFDGRDESRHGSLDSARHCFCRAPKSAERRVQGDPRGPGGPPYMVAIFLLAAVLSGCGYRISGQGEAMPKTVKTIAIPAFTTPTARYRLTRLLPTDIAREFQSRSRFIIVTDPEQADAVLTGELATFETGASITDPVSARATAAQVRVVLNLKLTDRHTGKTLFERKGADFFERYEIALNPNQYFDESSTAVTRLSRDVARDVVSAVLEEF
jgi:hypothetical protein